MTDSNRFEGRWGARRSSPVRSGSESHATLFLRRSDGAPLPESVAEAMRRVPRSRMLTARRGTRYEIDIALGESQLLERDLVADQIASIRHELHALGLQSTCELVLWLEEGGGDAVFSRKSLQAWIQCVDEIWCEAVPSTRDQPDRIELASLRQSCTFEEHIGSDAAERQEWLDAYVSSLTPNVALLEVRLISGTGTVGIVLADDALQRVATSVEMLRFTASPRGEAADE